MLVWTHTPSYTLCGLCLSKAAQSPRVATVPLACQDTCQVFANGKEEITPPRGRSEAQKPGLRTANWWNWPGVLHGVCAQSFPGAAWEKRTLGSRVAPLSGLCRGEAPAGEGTGRRVLLESQLGCLDSGPSQQQRRL